MKICLTKNLEPLRASALARADDATNAQIHDLVASPLAVLRAWKLVEATAVLDGHPPGALLTAEIFDQTMDLADLSARIVAKAAETKAFLGTIERRRQAAQAAIRAAKNPAEIEAALEEFLNGR
ncbi:hypothetical protein [Kaistia sp. MMO-174]|uniref:hypothetical protein n=1 Tax=Kaistia sp. MMO-174 TaxID=3081256 RepID=UPI0030163960